MCGKGGTLERACSILQSEHRVLFEFNSYFWNHGWLILGTPFFRNPSACNVARISGTNILSFALETICCFSPGWSFVICCLRYRGKISKWWCSLLGENTRLRIFPPFLKEKNDYSDLSINKVYKLDNKTKQNTTQEISASIFSVLEAIELEVSHLYSSEKCFEFAHLLLILFYPFSPISHAQSINCAWMPVCFHLNFSL